MKKIIIAAALLCAVGAGTFWFKYTDWVTIPKAQQLVADQLSDPSSAQFRNDRLIDYDWHCGEVNGKNSMGGYVGFKRFISGRLSKVTYLEGVGMMGKESTEEFLLVMDKVIANLKLLNAMNGQVPGLLAPTESEQYAKARNQVFDDHWALICERK